MLREILLMVSVLYTIALAAISLLSIGDFPNIEIDNGDKYWHAIAYGFLCLIWYLVLTSYNILQALRIAIFIAVVYGIVLEILQGVFTGSRISDIYDILANCAGVAFISFIILVRNKTHIKNL